MDFSSLEPGGVVQGVETVAKGLLAYGVTSFCPTIVTSTAEYYDAVRNIFIVCVHVRVLLLALPSPGASRLLTVQ